MRPQADGLATPVRDESQRWLASCEPSPERDRLLAVVELLAAQRHPSFCRAVTAHAEPEEIR